MLNYANGKLEKFLVILLNILAYLVVLVPIIVVPNSYFPYIIQKSLILRIILELTLAVYLVLALMTKEYRPKKSWLFWSILIFFGIMLLTTFTSQSFLRSWWGNWERMFGTFGYLHYLIWFMVLAFVFNKTKQWNRILNLTLMVSLVISLYAITQRLGWSVALQSGLERVNGTIGNAAFFASYLLIHLFISLLFLAEKNGWLNKFYYTLAFLLNLFVLILTGTRGALLALFFSFLFFIFLTFFLKLWHIKTFKILLVLSLSVLLASSALYLLRETNLVKNNYWLRRMTAFSSRGAASSKRCAAMQARPSAALRSGFLGSRFRAS